MLIDETLFKFDWYRAGVDDAPDSLMAVLVQELANGTLANELDVEPIPPMHNYDSGARITNGKVVYARILWGGNTGAATYCEATNYNSILLSDVLRSRYRNSHYVMRADSCLDVRGLCDSFITLAKALAKYAEQKNLKTKNMGDWSTARDGRSLYLGSRKSEAMLRFYEKGKQLGEQDDWLRFEVECNPKKMEKKLLFAHLTPFQMFSSCSAGQGVLGMLGIIPDLKGFVSYQNQPTNKDKALRHMIAQYANTMAYFADKDPFFYDWLKEEVEKARSA